MWYKNIAGRFFGLVTKHACDRRTDGRTDIRTDRHNYDSQDRASIAASRGKKDKQRAVYSSAVGASSVLTFFLAAENLSWVVTTSVKRKLPLKPRFFSSSCSSRRPFGIDKWHMLDIVPVTQPTVSKQWRKHWALTPVSGLTSSFPHSSLDSCDRRWRYCLYTGSLMLVPVFSTLMKTTFLLNPILYCAFMDICGEL